ncbi:COX15/CtaA family protein [Sphingomonas sp. RG327]|jgi:cytochrome c oxidase assembly protein subunit 15|uniref:Heme A synthase n=1 Tax=Sphingomonas anseongensis TaxID=2908207 RepID=A0ABT0RDF6_9SPHN|nr:COX15/CtaA family protein [Sphingomonas anseongensis]MCL6678286.1 COX15/CtaA family protein [Sphingomonas anseongensis]
MPTATANPKPYALANLLLFTAGLVFAMVVIGGITRLTESGLSITEWKPIVGAIPPLSHQDWVHAFDLYKQTPQYREVAGPAGMDLAGFKFIFLWEWVHRFLGRVIGLVFFGAIAWFAWKRAIPKGFTWRLIALFVLGGLQGAVGWLMVMSGLEGRTEVSPYRLSAHLLFALFLMGALIWTALDLRSVGRNRDARPAKLTAASIVTLAILFVQLLLGAWVAGFRAGYVSNSWPLMNDRFFPEGVDWSNGAGFALTHDPFLLHFLHRWWAWAVVATLVVFARKVRRAGSRSASIAIHSAFGTQIILGIATVTTGIALSVAVLHQAVGALVLASTVWGAHVVGQKR